MAAPPVKRIDRFEILRELGRGGQGAVYLAQDTRLGRQVALKTLHYDDPRQTARLLHEARISSHLQHPNIVSLFDMGEEGGRPYLVYAYIEGETLAQQLKRNGTLSVVQAVRVIAELLAGLEYAHQQGVLHLDIKPANIMIAANGTVMLMDFGIARDLSQLPDGAALVGTPQYLAPELIHGKKPDVRSDLYSVGMTLYELVTGKPAVNGENVFQMLHQNANLPAEAPSSRNIKVDERLEAIILKAISKKPEARYPDAGTMRKALQTYLDATEEKIRTTADGNSTLEFLLRRMRSKSDFPALSGTISEINRIVASESGSAGKLADAILQDYALTNKLLRLVNTVSYGQFGGKINTISKAVVILGFETVRNIAMTLILLEFLQNKSQAQELKDEVIAAFFAGTLAAQLAPVHRAGDAEEAMICAMFHNLGRMLAKFYFFEESQEVERLMEGQGLDEEKASARVLGIPYHQLGEGVAKSWRFPARLVAGMRKLEPGKVAPPHSEVDQLSVTVNLANELCAVSAVTDPKEKDQALHQLCVRFGDAANVTEGTLSKALDNGLHDLTQRSGILGINPAKSPLIKRIRNWSGHVEPAKEEKSGIEALYEETSLDQIAQQGEELPVDPEAMLSAGIQDVTNTLVEDFNLNDLLQMVLETIYRALRFRHVVIFIRDVKRNEMVARFGFGKHVDALIGRLHFSIKFEPDVFHLAIDKGADIVITDVMAENISGKIPLWYKTACDSQSFLLLPVMVNHKAIGLIYADMESANQLKITERQLSLLRTLRNQAVLAIKQKA